MIHQKLAPRSYPGQDVLGWWRQYVNGLVDDPEPIVRGLRPAAFGRTSCAGPPERDQFRRDVPMLAWLHVEKFFWQQFQWRYDRAALLMGRATNCEYAFVAWYARHPLLVVGVAERHADHQPDRVPYPLKDAVERWNALNPKALVTYTAARKASQAWQRAGDPQPRLAVTRPKGRPYTTLSDIREWIESDRRRAEKIEKSRNKAA